MADVLLTHSNHIFADKKQTAKMQPYPPLQILLVAAALEEAGLDVALYDPAFEASPETFHDALSRHRPDRLVICEDDFNFITKMCLAQNRDLALSMAAMAADHGVETFVHGSDATDHPLDYLQSGIRAVLVGEPEETIIEIARGADLDDIAGLVRSCSLGLHRNAPRTPRAELDELPLPAWRLVDVERYREAWLRAHGYFSLNLVSSRGCPYRCNWCAKPIFGSNYRAHSAERTAAEMSLIKRTVSPDQVWFSDDIFALSASWTRRFAEAVEARDAALPFKMQSRCDLMTRDTVAALHSAGCREVWMGAESGSQAVLDAMDKDIKVEDIYNARQNLRAHGIRACFFLQFGYPGETWREIEQTIRMVRETEPDDIGISVSYPLPGTKFHRRVSAQLGSQANWRESGDLAMMFRGEFSTDFYKALAEALHAEVRGTGDIDQAWTAVEELRTEQEVGTL